MRRIEFSNFPPNFQKILFFSNFQKFLNVHSVGSQHEKFKTQAKKKEKNIFWLKFFWKKRTDSSKNYSLIFKNFKFFSSFSLIFFFFESKKKFFFSKFKLKRIPERLKFFTIFNSINFFQVQINQQKRNKSANKKEIEKSGNK